MAMDLESIRETPNAVYRDRFPRGLRTPIEEKFLAGPRLYELGREITETCIRNLHPEADEETIQAMIRRRAELDRVPSP
jgi:hypothetical protein